MSAVYRTVFTLPISESKELHVVLEDRSGKVIFSLNEDIGEPVRRRLTFELSTADAMKLAKWIAGIGTVATGE